MIYTARCNVSWSFFPAHLSMYLPSRGGEGGVIIDQCVTLLSALGRGSTLWCIDFSVIALAAHLGLTKPFTSSCRSGTCSSHYHERAATWLLLLVYNSLL